MDINDQQNKSSSSEQEHYLYSRKKLTSSKIVPQSGMDFSHLTSQGQSLLKMMKQRGLDLTDNQVKKINGPRQYRSIEKQTGKPKQKSGYFDGGHAANIEELYKALNKAFSNADPQQANCILSHILQRKNLSPQDRNKFSIMKSNILFGLGAYQECLDKTQQFLENPINKLSAAIFSNYIAKCRTQLKDELFQGYFDLLRAKSLIEQYKIQNKQLIEENIQKKQAQNNYSDSELDTTVREINHTELEYSIKFSELKNAINIVYPHYPEFKNRFVKSVACGDYHTLFLIGKPLMGTHNTPKEGWQTQVFGIGQNTVGQITGRSNHIMYKQPVLISSLSGKSIQGIWATKETSLAFDKKGNIYQWGVKENRNDLIEITYSVNERIKSMQKGYKHYAVLTESDKFYTWGTIQHKGVQIYKKDKPHMHTVSNISDFSCGDNYTIVLADRGSCYALGDNQYGQLGIQGEKYNKQFKVIKNMMMGELKKVFCISHCTFFVNTDQQIFFCGKYSYEKQPQLRIRQAQFYGQPSSVVSISGTIGSYYLNDTTGTSYKWQVDSSVKFKQQKEDKFEARYIVNTRGAAFKIKTLINPRKCIMKRITQDENLKTYEPVEYELILKDDFGLYGNSFLMPVKLNIFLSTYAAKMEDLQKENNNYIQSIQNIKCENTVIANQFLEPRILSYNINRQQDEPWKCKFTMQIQKSGKYYFYAFLDEDFILAQDLKVQISEREQMLATKNRQQRQKRQMERLRKAEQQRQRLLEEKKRKEEQEEQRKKETQRRAEQALRKHMRQQQDQRVRIQQERKRKQQLQTGGGFDLNKLKKKNIEVVTNDSGTLFQRTSMDRSGQLKLVKKSSSQKQPESTSSLLRRKNSMEKTGESFLPDINTRPSSKRKLGLPKPSQLVNAISKAQQSKQSLLDITTTASLSSGFKNQKGKPAKLAQNFGSTGSNLGAVSTGRTLIKRGMSKSKNKK